MMRFEDLLERLRLDYPELIFRSAHKFKFRPPRTIYYENPDEADNDGLNTKKMDLNLAKIGLDISEYNNYRLQLLHEVGHAILKHRDFTTDLTRVKMECAAWVQAQKLCQKYQIYYDEEFAEAELDTYRDWLHQRSVCKKCGLTRYQDEKGVYHCPMCEEFAQE